MESHTIYRIVWTEKLNSPEVVSETVISSISDCSDTGLTAVVNYGNGLIQFQEKSFCANGVCNDVTICQIVTNEGEEKYYVPVEQDLNIMRGLVNTFDSKHNAENFSVTYK